MALASHTETTLDPCQLQAEPGVYGACPNCGRTLHVQARGCPHCRAIFDETSAWHVRPDAMRVPDEGTFAALQPENPLSIAGGQVDATNVHATPSLAEQILKSQSVVTLEAYAREFDAGECTSVAFKDWMGLCVIGVFCMPGIFIFSETWAFLVLATPLAVLVLYAMQSGVMHKESGTRKVQLDLKARQLTVDHQMPDRSESFLRRVPFEELRLIQRRTSSSSEGDVSWFRKIELQVPHDPFTPQVADYLLFTCDDYAQALADALYQALLVHTGIPEGTEGAEISLPFQRIRALR